MNQQEMRKRTKAFALRIIRLVSALPRNRIGDVIGRQVLKSGTSIGANYREALRASSRKHFASTCEIVLRETDETLYWLELLMEGKVFKPSLLQPLMKECGELVAIFASTVKSTRSRSKKPNLKSEI